MKLSLLLLSLCVLFVAIEITPATSNYLRLRGESGASGASGPADASGPEGNSTNGTDEAEKLGHGHIEFIANQNNIPARLKEISHPNDMIITMGAGNIWRQCEGIYEALNN